MPTIREVDGFSVRVYTRGEHRPAHVHVEKAGTRMKIIIRPGEVEYHSHKGRVPTRVEKQRAMAIVAGIVDECLVVWYRLNERG